MKVLRGFCTAFCREVLKSLETGFSEGMVEHKRKGRPKTQGGLPINKKQFSVIGSRFSVHVKWQDSARHFLKQLLINIKVGVDVLHVFVFFQRFQQADHSAGMCAVELDVVLWNHLHAG